MPGGGQRPGLGFAIADDAGDDQVGIVEGGAIGMRQRIAEFATLMDGAGHVGCGMARNSARKRELPEQLAHALLVHRDVRIELAIGAFEIGVGHHRRAAMAGAADVDHIGIPGPDNPVQMRVDEAQSRRRAPVAEKPWLDVLQPQAARAAAGCRAGRSGRSSDNWRHANRRRSGEVPVPTDGPQRLVP